jgi:hypothetical protein
MNEALINAPTNPAGGLNQATEREDRRVLRLVLLDALASEAMGTLTTGVFLVGFAVALGADNFAIGVLAAVPFFAQLLQIPAVLLVDAGAFAGISACLVRPSVAPSSLGQRLHRSSAVRSGSRCSSPHLRFIKAWQRSPAALGILGCEISSLPANTDAFLGGAQRLQRRFRWLLLWVAEQSLIFGKATCPNMLYSATHCCFW